MELNDVFYLNQLKEYADFANKNGYMIIDLEPNSNGERMFKIIEAIKPTQEEINKNKIDALKKELASYDYIAVKIATGVATKEQYSEQIQYCEYLREKIRQLGG